MVQMGMKPHADLKDVPRAIELASRAADEHTESDARRSVVWALMASGEREQIRAQTAAAFAVAERLRDRWSLASAGFDNARLSVYEGDWQAAREMSDVVRLKIDPRGRVRARPPITAPRSSTACSSAHWSVSSAPWSA